MKGLEEIVEENKKADEVTKGEIKLEGNIIVKAGNTNEVIYITDGVTTIGLTQTVLQAMIRENNSDNKFRMNRKILDFLHTLY